MRLALFHCCCLSLAYLYNVITFAVVQVFDNLVELQKEITLSIQDVTKMQKIYKEEEHVAHDARIKAAEADDK
jgi:hypothetical protein